MESTAKAFPTIRELEKIGRSNLRQKIFLYPILLQDDLYGIVYNRFVNESEYKENTIHDLTNEFDFLILRRLIGRLSESKFLYVTSEKSKKNFRFIREILIIILNHIFPFRARNPSRTMNEWNSNQSIHSVFPFIEDRFRNPSYYLDITIPYSFHPETLIRTFRQYILDIPFLHLLRLLLHRNGNLFFLSESDHSKKNLFYRFLWNFHTHTMEYSLIHLWKQIRHFQFTSFSSFSDGNDFTQKIADISQQADFQIVGNISEKKFWVQYLRYQNNLVLATNGDSRLIENWKFLFIVLWDKYYHSWLEPYKILIGNLSNNALSILGYTLSTKNTLIKNRIRFINSSIETSLIVKEFCIIIPVIAAIKLLARDNFCDVSGRPICRLSWTTLTDNEIFERFDQIMKNIYYYYYGGCRERKGLYQLQYIFRFSCAKTLACKHKSTVRTVWKKYSSNFVINSVSLKEKELIPLNIWIGNQNEKRFWRLSITRMNFLANLLQKLKNIRNYEK